MGWCFVKVDKAVLPHEVTSNGRMVCDDNLDMVWKEAIMDNFEVLCPNSMEEPREIIETSVRKAGFWITSLTWSPRIPHKLTQESVPECYDQFMQIMHVTVLPLWKPTITGTPHVLSYVHSISILFPTYKKFVYQLTKLTIHGKEICYLTTANAHM